MPASFCFSSWLALTRVRLLNNAAAAGVRCNEIYYSNGLDRSRGFCCTFSFLTVVCFRLLPTDR